jgi:hypothetical protein
MIVTTSMKPVATIVTPSPRHAQARAPRYSRPLAQACAQLVDALTVAVIHIGEDGGQVLDAEGKVSGGTVGFNGARFSGGTVDFGGATFSAARSA